MVSLEEDLERFVGKIERSSDPRRSIVFCTRMLKSCSDKSGPYSKWARELLKQRQYQKAKQKFKKSIQISPNKADLYDDWMVGLYYAREFEEVIILAERYPDKFEYPHLGQNALGICFLHFGDYENAIRYFQKAILVRESDEIAYFNWALALYLQGKKEEALEMNEKAYKIHRLPVRIYQRELKMLEEDLKREENRVFEDLIKAKIKGFEYFIDMDRAR